MRVAAVKRMPTTIRNSIKEMRPGWDVAVTRNPYQDYLQKTLDAQGKVLDEINAYLAYPWLWRWRKLFGG